MITYNYISAINRDYLEFDKAKVRKVLFNTNRTLGFSSTINKKCEQIIETSRNKLSVVEIEKTQKDTNFTNLKELGVQNNTHPNRLEPLRSCFLCLTFID